MAAVKSDGSVLTWGDAVSGGDSTTVRSQLAGGVAQVVAGNFAMAAVKSDGSVLTWGHASCGGNCTTVRSQLDDGVEHVIAGGYAMANVTPSPGGGPVRRRIRGKRPGMPTPAQERRQRYDA